MGTAVSSSVDRAARKLAGFVGSIAREDGLIDTAWPGLIVSRISTPMARQPISYRPSLCMVVQGQKRIFLAEESYTYDSLNYLVVPLALPLEMEIVQASPKSPVLGLGLDLDLTMVSELLLGIDESPAPLPSVDRTRQALFVSQTNSTVQGALIRLFRLLDSPADLRILGPSVVREITYRLLQGGQAGQLRQLVLRDSGSYRIAGLVRFLNENFSERLSTEDIARVAGMSTSSLHHKFREVVGMSPLQYLKKIRLHRARTMMMDRGLNASEAGFRVGYSNPSQFSREFKRLFGLPPAQLMKEILSTTP